MRPLLLLPLLAACSASAAERRETVTDFERIRVDGDFQVEVRTGPPASVVVSGPQRGVDATQVSVQGRTLVIRRSAQSWGGWPGSTAQATRVRVTVPVLAQASLGGSGSLSVDRMRAQRVSIGMSGSGAMNVAQVQADQAGVALQGAGSVTVGGTAANVALSSLGAGTADLSGLAAADLKLTANGAGVVRAAARRSAMVNAAGSGDVIVLGNPACTVANAGSGTVICGSDKAQRR
jgi:hypothetical protein